MPPISWRVTDRVAPFACLTAWLAECAHLQGESDEKGGEGSEEDEEEDEDEDSDDEDVEDEDGEALQKACKSSTAAGHLFEATGV